MKVHVTIAIRETPTWSESGAYTFRKYIANTHLQIYKLFIKFASFSIRHTADGGDTTSYHRPTCRSTYILHNIPIDLPVRFSVVHIRTVGTAAG